MLRSAEFADNADRHSGPSRLVVRRRKQASGRGDSLRVATTASACEPIVLAAAGSQSCIRRDRLVVLRKYT